MFNTAIVTRVRANRLILPYDDSRFSDELLYTDDDDVNRFESTLKLRRSDFNPFRLTYIYIYYNTPYSRRFFFFWERGCYSGGGRIKSYNNIIHV